MPIAAALAGGCRTRCRWSTVLAGAERSLRGSGWTGIVGASSASSSSSSAASSGSATARHVLAAAFVKSSSARSSPLARATTAAARLAAIRASPASIAALLDARAFFYTPAMAASMSTVAVAETRSAREVRSSLSSSSSSLMDDATCGADAVSSLDHVKDTHDRDLPRRILGTSDLGFLTGNIRKLIQSEHPLLATVAEYYFSEEGKKLRPLLVMLMAQAAGEAHTAALQEKHLTLAMTTELIHTASLLHDDVIDEADRRRGQPAVQVAYGNKLAILGGDFLLSRASVALASLENTRVVSLLAQVVGDLVEGEVMQMQGRVSGATSTGDERNRSSWRRTWMCALDEGERITGIDNDDAHDTWHHRHFEAYLRKTYLKTASLMAKSCKAAVLLHDDVANPRGDSSRTDIAQLAYDYGKHLGIAFQLTDDLLDYTGSADDTGKPAGGSDLKLGLATAPVLFASLDHPELITLIDGKFNGTTDAPDPRTVHNVFDMVRASRGLDRTRRLAQWYADRAREAAEALPRDPARDVLVELARNVVDRRK